MTKFGQTVVDVPRPRTDLPPHVGQIDRAVPTRTPGVQPDVVVPAGRSVVSGGCLFLVVAYVAAILTLVYHWPWWMPLVVGVGAALVTSAWRWFQEDGRWFQKDGNSALWATETITGRDLDGDGQVGRPSFEIVEATPSPYGDNLKMFDLPDTPEKFAQVCYKALTGGSLTQAVWCGKGKPYNKGDWTELCDEMVAREWWAWNNPDHHPSGIAALPEGKRKMAQWLEVYTRTHAHARPAAQIEPPAEAVGE